MSLNTNTDSDRLDRRGFEAPNASLVDHANTLKPGVQIIIQNTNGGVTNTLRGATEGIASSTDALNAARRPLSTPPQDLDDLVRRAEGRDPNDPRDLNELVTRAERVRNPNTPTESGEIGPKREAKKTGQKEEEIVFDRTLERASRRVARGARETWDADSVATGTGLATGTAGALWSSGLLTPEAWASGGALALPIAAYKLAPKEKKGQALAYGLAGSGAMIALTGATLKSTLFTVGAPAALAYGGYHAGKMFKQPVLGAAAGIGAGMMLGPTGSAIMTAATGGSWAAIGGATASAVGGLAVPLGMFAAGYGAVKAGKWAARKWRERQSEQDLALAA